MLSIYVCYASPAFPSCYYTWLHLRSLSLSLTLIFKFNKLSYIASIQGHDTENLRPESCFVLSCALPFFGFQILLFCCPFFLSSIQSVLPLMLHHFRPPPHIPTIHHHHPLDLLVTFLHDLLHDM